MRLLGKQEIHWPGVRPMESTDCLDKDVTLCDELGDVPLDKGEHTFEFQILVPSSTPPYEKSQYGRVRHTVVSILPSVDPLPNLNLKSIARSQPPKDSARTVGTLSRRKSCTSYQMYATRIRRKPEADNGMQPAGPGASRPPPPLHLKHGSFSEDVGVSTFCPPPTRSQADESRSPTLSSSNPHSSW